jgi:hypothetical protein
MIDLGVWNSMSQPQTGFLSGVFQSVAKERAGLAAAAIVAVLLVAFFKAPILPVAGGSLAALGLLLGWSHFRTGSGTR